MIMVFALLRSHLKPVSASIVLQVPPTHEAHIDSPESSFVLYCAPHHVIDVYKRGLDCITEWDSDITEEILFYDDFIIEPLTSVLVDRTEQPLLPVTQKQPIIDEIVGEHDRCSCPPLFSVDDCLFGDRLAVSIRYCQVPGSMGTK